MRGDFSRVTFRPEHHYSGVRLQQGRVLLDAEFNEHIDIDAHRHAETTGDVVGPHGVPYDGGGFLIGFANRLRDVRIGESTGWAVGEDALLLHLDVERFWVPAPAPPGTGDLEALDFISPESGSGYAVGGGAGVLALSEDVWTREDVPPGVRAHLYDVCATADGRAWAVGERGTILHRGGDGQWVSQSPPEGTTATLRGVHIFQDDSQEVGRGWAVGDDATILATADGTTWVSQRPPEGTGNLRAVFSLRSDRAWAVGDGGTILFWNGSTWKREDTPPDTLVLRAVHVPEGTGDGIAVGDNGTVLVNSGDGSSWTSESLQLPVGEPQPHLHGLYVSSLGPAFAVGDDASFTREVTPEGVKWFAGPPLPSDSGQSLTISAGDLYVDGVRAVNEHLVSLTGQPDLTFTPPPDTEPEPVFPPPDGEGTYGVYLEIFDDHVTALDREELREVALAGPDTATRTRTVWQAKLLRLSAPPDEEPSESPSYADLEKNLPEALGGGRLRARTKPPEEPAQNSAKNAPPPECSPVGGGGFRRLENQLYRVEIHEGVHQGDDVPATFVWSRDNGMVAARLEAVEMTPEPATEPATVSVTVSHPGRDEVLAFGPGQWVELTDETRALRGDPGVLLEIKSVRGNVLETELRPPPTVPLTMADFPVRPTARRWDGRGPAKAGVDLWHPLEDGIQVQFAGTPSRTGDYWMIPARSVTGAVEWPNDAGVPLFQRPHGPRRHFAPLALIDFNVFGMWSNPRDCRRRFPSLTGLVHFFYVGGGGQEATPDLGADAPHFVKLDQPLQVGVSNWRWPVAGAPVKFEVLSGGGLLFDRETEELKPAVTVPTGPDGIAACEWHLNGTVPDTGSDPVITQQVKTTLLDEHEQPMQTPIVFDANLSIAAEVAYDGRACGTLQGQKTVQSAIQTLSSLTRLFPVTGTGIDLGPGQPDEEPLTVEVVVVNDCGPVSGAVVEFAPAANSGSVSTPTATTNSQGRATTLWAVDSATPTQRVTATLLNPGFGNVAHLPDEVAFVANRNVASDTAYSPVCAVLATAGTVQQAIDTLALLPRLFHVSGDGTHAAPGQPVVLEIGVASDCGPDFGDYEVEFRRREGNGTFEGVDGDSVIVRTSGGRAGCTYLMGSDTRHLVEARLIRERIEPVEVYEPPVFFTIIQVDARQVSYTPGCELLTGVNNVQDAVTVLCGALGTKPSNMLHFELEPDELTTMEDQAGLWEYEGGRVIDPGSSQIGTYASSRRSVHADIGQLNAAMLTLTIFFFGNTPPENITCQGAHSFNTGGQSGSVSAASAEFAAFIGRTFRRDGSTFIID